MRDVRAEKSVTPLETVRGGREKSSVYSSHLNPPTGEPGAVENRRFPTYPLIFLYYFYLETVTDFDSESVSPSLSVTVRVTV